MNDIFEGNLKISFFILFIFGPKFKPKGGLEKRLSLLNMEQRLGWFY
jgi:hypothetical protein